MPIPYDKLKSGDIKVMTIGLTAKGVPALMQFFSDTKYLDMEDWEEELKRIDPEEKLEAVIVFQVAKVVYRIREETVKEI